MVEVGNGGLRSANLPYELTLRKGGVVAKGKGKGDRIVSFASAHRTTVLPCFNAYTALLRVESLLEDAERLKVIHN